MTKEEKLTYCKEYIKELDSQYLNIDRYRKEAIQFCNGDENIVKVIEGRSKIVTTDMQDAIDMAMPDILETLTGTDEPLKLDPVGPEDVESVKKLQVLGNLNLRNKNNWFRLCFDFLDDSMKLKIGHIKYRYVKKTDEIEKPFMNLEDDELQAKLDEDPEATVYSDETDENGDRKTVIVYKVHDEYVELHGVPAERLKFPIDTRDFDSCPFVVEEVLLHEHEFVALYDKDKLKKVKDLTASFENVASNSVTTERFKDLGGLAFLYDKKSKRYKIHECYFYETDNYKPWIFSFCGDVDLVDEKNPYRKPPYRGGSPFLLAHRLIGQGYLDRLREIQRQRTDFKRMLFDWVRMGLFRRYFLNINSNINMDDYLNHNASNAVIRVDGPIDKTDIVPEERAPLLSEAFNFWEAMNIEKDYHIPTPRSYSGVEGASDEKTYRGKKLKVTQAGKKILMMIRAYMEDVFKPLFEDMNDCFSIFMDKTVTRRYLNEDYEISPKDTLCKCNVIVNVGLGSHDKDSAIAKLQQLIGLATKQPDICTPQDRWYMMKELVKVMGFLNTNDFVTDPQLKEAVMMLIQGVLTHIQGLKQLGLTLPDEQILMQMIQQVAQAVGMPLGENQGGENSQGTQPGENTPNIEEQPANAREPVLTTDGGGYFG